MLDFESLKFKIPPLNAPERPHYLTLKVRLYLTMENKESKQATRRTVHRRVRTGCLTCKYVDGDLQNSLTANVKIGFGK